jgi:two-component system cell cycle response regulator
VNRSGGESNDAALLHQLRARLRAQREAATANEHKWQRTLERELELLRAETLPELLECVTTGLATSYGLDAVQLVVEDPNHEIQHLLLGLGDRPDEFPGVRFVDTLVGLAPRIALLRRPWLGVWVGADHALLFPGNGELKSLALLPLRRQAHTVGMLCFGSRDPERFHHGLSADFLQHLASVVAVCFENAGNRARVLRSGLADYLTGWHNRRYLHSRLREELAAISAATRRSAKRRRASKHRSAPATPPRGSAGTSSCCCSRTRRSTRQSASVSGSGTRWRPRSMSAAAAAA